MHVIGVLEVPAKLDDLKSPLQVQRGVSPGYLHFNFGDSRAGFGRDAASMMPWMH